MDNSIYNNPAPRTPAARPAGRAREMGSEEFKRYFAARRRASAGARPAPPEPPRSERQVSESVNRPVSVANGGRGAAAPRREGAAPSALRTAGPRHTYQPGTGTRSAGAHPPFAAPARDKNRTSGTAGRSRAPGPPDSAVPATAPVPAKASRAAGHAVAAVSAALGVKSKDNELLGRTLKLAEEWIAVDGREYRAEGERKKIPLMTMIAILTVALSLLLIVSGSVIASSASRELSRAEAKLEEHLERLEELEFRLELKNDLRYFEQIARTQLGMIDREYAPVVYIGGEIEDSVVIHEKDEGILTGLAALLSALGFIRRP